MPPHAKYKNNPKNKNKYNPSPKQERPTPVENCEKRGFRWKTRWKIALNDTIL